MISIYKGIIMSKRSFEIFAEVCDRQSMSEAAKALELSQPAVSAAIASLEKEYETKLFIRRGKTLQLSEPGRRLRQYADIILDQYSRAWDDLHEQPQTEQFVIGVSDCASEIFLPSLIRKIPDSLNLSFVSADTQTVISMLREHQCSLCVADHHADENGFTYLPLYKEEYVFAASDDYTKETSMGMNTLLNQKLLLREKGASSRAVFEAAVMKKSAEIHPFVESVSDLSLITLAQNGAGITVLPQRLIEKSLKKKRLHTIRVKGTDLRRQYYLVYRSDMHINAPFESLIETIRNCA